VRAATLVHLDNAEASATARYCALEETSRLATVALATAQKTLSAAAATKRQLERAREDELEALDCASAAQIAQLERASEAKVQELHAQMEALRLRVLALEQERESSTLAVQQQAAAQREDAEQDAAAKLQAAQDRIAAEETRHGAAEAEVRTAAHKLSVTRGTLDLIRFRVVAGQDAVAEADSVASVLSALTSPALRSTSLAVQEAGLAKLSTLCVRSSSTENADATLQWIARFRDGIPDPPPATATALAALRHQIDTDVVLSAMSADQPADDALAAAAKLYRRYPDLRAAEQSELADLLTVRLPAMLARMGDQAAAQRAFDDVAAAASGAPALLRCHKRCALAGWCVKHGYADQYGALVRNEVLSLATAREVLADVATVHGVLGMTAVRAHTFCKRLLAAPAPPELPPAAAAGVGAAGAGAAADPEGMFAARLTDVQVGAGTGMGPIQGVMSSPLLSLDAAMKLLRHLFADEDIATAVWCAMTFATNFAASSAGSNASGPALHETAALNLYTQQLVYARLNLLLRDEKREKLKPFFPFLKLVLTGLEKLPRQARSIFRGIKADLRAQFKAGQMVTWWGFSSCTTDGAVLQSDAFCGSQGHRTLFIIKAVSARDISMYSSYDSEKEVAADASHCAPGRASPSPPALTGFRARSPPTHPPTHCRCCCRQDVCSKWTLSCRRQATRN
jgi:hypothetical protein